MKNFTRTNLAGAGIMAAILGGFLWWFIDGVGWVTFFTGLGIGVLGFVGSVAFVSGWVLFSHEDEETRRRNMDTTKDGYYDDQRDMK